MVHEGVFTIYPRKPSSQNAQTEQQTPMYLQSPKIDNLDFCDAFPKVRPSPLAPGWVCYYRNVKKKLD